MEAGITSMAAAGLVSRCLMLAKERGLRIAAAVVDAGGNLISFQRDDGVFIAAIDAAWDKARTANAFHRSTAEMQVRLEQGKLSYLALKSALPLEGGVPIRVGGAVVGGLGVSGAQSRVDHEIAAEVVNDLALINCNTRTSDV